MNPGFSIDDAIRKVNRRIAEIRMEKGLTQAQLAEMMDMGLRDLQDLEKDASMTLITLFRFVEALECNPKDFFDEPKTENKGRGRPRRINRTKRNNANKTK